MSNIYIPEGCLVKRIDVDSVDGLIKVVADGFFVVIVNAPGVVMTLKRPEMTINGYDFTQYLYKNL